VSVILVSFGFEALTCGKGSPEWTRTTNPAINSRMLCQLSYGGPNRAVATGDHNTRSGVRMLTAG
jgi:hypothetical protein